MNLEPKEYIKKNWSTSSGKRITEMLLHYKPYFFKKTSPVKKIDIVEEAKKIFEI